MRYMYTTYIYNIYIYNIHIYMYIYICIYIYVCIYARGLQMSRKKTLLLTKRAKRVIIFKIREDLHLNCN